MLYPILVETLTPKESDLRRALVQLSSSFTFLPLYLLQVLTALSIIISDDYHERHSFNRNSYSQLYAGLFDQFIRSKVLVLFIEITR